jgi:hypothetical protein
MRGGGGLTLELLDQLRGEFYGEPAGSMLVPVEHHVLGLLLAVQKRKSQKIVETKTCTILSLIFTPDPPFDMLLSILSIISTAALTG